MIRKILVPLDGSALAEAALPGALWISRIFGANLILLHVIEHNAPASVHGERHLRMEEEAMKYLKSVASSFPEDVHAELHVHTEEVRNVPRSIALHAAEMVVDLIVMCSHGKSGLRQLMMGSIAQQVISLASTPVLLIQPQKEQESLFANPRCILVALDEDPEHACGLGLAGAIGQRSEVSLRLVNIVPRLDSLHGSEAATGRLLPVATSALLEIEMSEAKAMLAALAHPWAEKGIDVNVEVRRGDPPAQIAQAAAEAGAAMIVLGTHGKAGMDAFWAGSVAPRMPAMTDLPLLLVPTCRNYEEN